MKTYAPTEASALLIELFQVFPDMARSVIRGTALEQFNAAVEAVEAVAKQQPTAATCLEMETQLGLMVNLLLDAPLLSAKPRDQVQTLIDAVEIAGSALASASGTREAANVVLH